MIVVILVGILAVLLGFGLGVLAATVYYSSQAKKAQRQWDRQRKTLDHDTQQLRQQLAEQQKLRQYLERQKRLLERENQQLKHQLWNAPLPKEESRIVRAAPKAEAVPEAPVQAPAPQAAEDPLRQIYRNFSTAETLELQFQYSFPDALTFVQGRGYLRSPGNQLLPEQTVISRSNNAVGFAMEGLFRVYDVVYEGREYTFRQIMDGELGTGFVRISRVLQLAQVQEIGHFGQYKLANKGKLEVVAVQ